MRKSRLDQQENLRSKVSHAAWFTLLFCVWIQDAKQKKDENNQKEDGVEMVRLEKNVV